MRGLLTLLGLVILIGVVLLYFGIIRLDQTRAGVVQAPEFHADVAKVSMGTENKTVAVPTIQVSKPGASATPAP